MRKPRDHLGRQFTFAGLLQGLAGLGFLGDVHRQDINAALRVGVKGHADAAGRGVIGKLYNGRGALIGLIQCRLDPSVSKAAQGVTDRQADNLARTARQDMRQTLV